MFAKALAITALLGSTDAKKTLEDLSDKEIEGLQIAKGFFEGSNTVSRAPTNKDEMTDCLMYLDHIHGYADEAYPKL